MNNEEKKAIEYWKNYMDILHWNTQLASEHHMSVLLNLIEKQAKEIEDKKEEMYAIARANYILGQTEERSQWYKKINEKYKELTQEEKETDGIVMNTKEKKILKELIGKEE